MIDANNQLGTPESSGQVDERRAQLVAIKPHFKNFDQVLFKVVNSLEELVN
ncbi:MAG: hypothetical protein WAN92_06760 [Herbaspirillum sp.]